ncbi:MAG: DUF2157 domain-containing protein [Proteobacteria bacterium]|nr:DUF2157 domain-containing protein [Pseudomonadota bacterium]
MPAPPEPKATVARLHALRRFGALSDAALAEGVRQLTATRAAKDWRRWLTAVALSLGVLQVFGSSAYYAVVNWTEMGRYGQIGLALGSFVLAAVGGLRLGTDGLGGKLVTTVAGGLIGPLLVVLAAVYPSEGDWWTLLATWAVLMVPFVLAARLSAAALGWVAVLNITALAFFEPAMRAFRDLPMSAPGLALAAVNLGGLAVWELLAPRVEWMHGRWPQRVLGAAGIAALVATALPTIYDEVDAAGLIALPALVALLVVAQALYWPRARDLFLAAAPLLAAIMVIANAGARAIIELFDKMLLVVVGTPVLVMVLLGMTVAVLAWLRAGHALAQGDA